MNDDQITQLLTEAAPKPRAEFTDALDQRVARGFREPQLSERAAPLSVRERASRRIRTAFDNRRLSFGTSLVAGTCALVLVAVVAVPIALNGDDETGSDTKSYGSTVSGESNSTTEIAPSAGATADMAIPQDSAVSAAAPPARMASKPIGAGDSQVTEQQRQHILGVGMFLEVEPKQVPDVVAKSTKVAESLGGYVADSSYNVTGELATGTAELWVPTKQNAVAMARLARLGTVIRTTQGSDDVTDARAEDERQIAATKDELRKLGSKATKAQRDALQARLDAQQRQLDNLDKRIAMSRITFNVNGVVPEEKIDEPAEPWTIEWAWDKTGDIFRHLAAGAIVFGAVLLIPVILISAIWFTVATRRRRQRERTLDDKY